MAEKKPKTPEERKTLYAQLRPWVGYAAMGAVGVAVAVIAVPQLKDLYDHFHSAEYLHNVEVHKSFLAQIKEAGFSGTFSAGTEREILASGGIDVKENGQWGRWNIVWNPDGTIADIDKEGNVPLGTGDFLIEDANEDTPEFRYDVHDKKSDARPVSVLDDYDDTTDILKNQGAHPYDPAKDKKYSGDVARLVNNMTGGKHPVEGAGTAFDEVKSKGGFQDTHEPKRAWKVWVDPKRGPFLVLDKDGDSSLPYFTEITGDTKTAPQRSWYGADGKLLGSK